MTCRRALRMEVQRAGSPPPATPTPDKADAPAQAGECWAFVVRRVRELVSIELPTDWAGVLAAPTAIAEDVGTCWALQVGDLVLMRGWFSPRDHVGVAIDAFTIEHLDSDGRAAAVPIAAARRSGVVKRVMRPRKRPQMNADGRGSDLGLETGHSALGTGH